MNFPHPAAPVLARPEPLHAPALKAPQEAGRRGGESIARRVINVFSFPISNRNIFERFKNSLILG
nr:hypothetical protein [Citrobacter freundii]